MEAACHGRNQVGENYLLLRYDKVKLQLMQLGTLVARHHTTKQATESCATMCEHGVMKCVLWYNHPIDLLEVDDTRTSLHSAKTGSSLGPSTLPSTPNALRQASSCPLLLARLFHPSTPTIQSLLALNRKTGTASTTSSFGMSSSEQAPLHRSSLDSSWVLRPCRSLRPNLCKRRSSPRY